jgi:uncharacterized protein (TIRG00374 family)
VKVAFGLAVTVLLAWLLVREIGAAAVVDSLRKADLAWAAVAFCCYVACYLFRAVRFSVMLQHKLSFTCLFSVVCLHNLLTSLLPFRSGELSYPYMLSRRGIGAGEGIATLVLARIFDFISIAIAFLIAMSFLPALPPLVQGSIWTISIFLAALVAACLLSVFAAGIFVSAMKRMVPKSLQRHKAGIWAWKKLREVVAAAKALRGKMILKVMLSSAGIWVFQFLIYGALLKSIGIQLGFAGLVVTVTLVSLASAIPIQGLAGIGTNEAYWTAVLMALGIEKGPAIAAAFAQHFFVIVFYVILGLLGATIYYRFGKKEKAR